MFAFSSNGRGVRSSGRSSRGDDSSSGRSSRGDDSSSGRSSDDSSSMQMLVGFLL